MKKRLKKIVKTVLRTDGEPKDIALAFATGVFIAFFPLPGHTLMALGTAWFMKLSLAIVFAGTFINNPWTIFLLYGSGLYVGLWVTGRSVSEAGIDWSNLNAAMLMESAKTLFVPFFIGNLLLGALFSIIGYLSVLKAVVAYRQKRIKIPFDEGDG
ncbi:MAG: hypothetical protein IEMM0002_1238 [bacterium]|nr:MAG: hypothetical protein IEMM0002_1238 [bacterium]